MYLHRDDIRLINEIIEDFPDVEVFRIKSDNSSGIGAVAKLTVTTKVLGRQADITFVISSVENW